MSPAGLTEQQAAFAAHEAAAFVEACPGAGKTRTIVARIQRLAQSLPPRKGVAILSFTNSAVEEFQNKCAEQGLHAILRYPSFVGTFDGFLRHFLLLPGGIEGVDHLPIVVDSWATLGIEIRLTGAQAFRGSAVKLDSFDPETNQVNFDTIGNLALRAHVQANQDAYIRAAQGYRTALRSRGYLSAGDARVEVLRRLRDPRWAESLGQAIASRFAELIVDEAQDCNSQDIRILKWLGERRLPVTAVADPDQAIYGFRHGSPTSLREFRERYAPDNRLSITGNFRSSPSICSLSATLRERVQPDESIGEARDVRHPLQVITYEGRVSDGLGTAFAGRLAHFGLELKASIVLAHKRSVAQEASGNGGSGGDSGQSRVQKMAKAVSELALASSNGRERESSLRDVEEILLDMMGKRNAGENVIRAAHRLGIDLRWLRRVSLEFCLRLPTSCEDSNDGRQAWVNCLREEALRLALPCPDRFSAARFFSSPRTEAWSEWLQQAQPTGLRHSTIHDAKGREFESVFLVVPPDIGRMDRTESLVLSWERRAENEAKRVVYVGATRAQRLLAIGLPTSFSGRLQAILRGSQVPFEIHAS